MLPSSDKFVNHLTFSQNTHLDFSTFCEVDKLCQGEGPGESSQVDNCRNDHVNKGRSHFLIHIYPTTYFQLLMIPVGWRTKQEVGSEKGWLADICFHTGCDSHPNTHCVFWTCPDTSKTKKYPFLSNASPIHLYHLNATGEHIWRGKQEWFAAQGSRVDCRIHSAKVKMCPT